MVERKPLGSSQLNASRRDTGVVIVAMATLAALAWAYVVWMPADGMGNGILTDQPSMRGMPGMPTQTTPGALPLVLFVGTWTVMMVAMMFPAAAPVVLVFDRWRRSRRRPVAATATFVAGYLAIWSLAGVAGYVLMQVLDTLIAPSPAATLTGGGVLVLAGVYQLSPLKRACLAHCRSPLSLIMTHGQTLGHGLVGPLRVGITHGAYCLGCCWALMAVLITLGVMNPGWMAAVSAVILAEKVLPGGGRTAVAVGVLLIGAGITVAVHGL